MDIPVVKQVKDSMNFILNLSDSKCNLLQNWISMCGDLPQKGNPQINAEDLIVF